MVTFPERLAYLMQQQRFNNSTLGRALGVTHSTVARWLAGSTPGGETLQLLAMELGVSAQYLISGGDLPESQSSSVREDPAVYGSKPAQQPDAAMGEMLALLIPKLGAAALLDTIEALNEKKPPGWEALASQAIALLKEKIPAENT
ncbi:MAG: helix-turn-helix domain-containing protein [Luteolibacter sp.]